MNKPKLLRITTVPVSLHYLLRGQLTFMKDNGFDVLAISADGKERQDVVNEGITHFAIPFTRQITPLRDLICLFKLILLIRKLKPQIVHTHTPKAGLLGMLASWICGVPSRLHTVAGLPMMETQGLKRWVLRRAEKMTYGCAHKVYPNSKGLLEFILTEFRITGYQLPVTSLRKPTARFQVSSSKFQVIGNGSSNGIDVNHFTRTDALEEKAKAIRQHYQIADTAIIFCFIGRVVNDKGIKELIEAFRQLHSKRDDIYLLLVGPLEQELDPLSAGDLEFLNTHPHVIMAGFQRDVRPWLLASNVFVFPSYREGFPNVVMQAACMEVPCIVSDINGCNEIIQHNETGIVVSVKNSDALYEAMITLINDEALRISVGRKSREYVVDNFDQQYVWGELLKEYRDRIKNPNETLNLRNP